MGRLAEDLKTLERKHIDLVEENNHTSRVARSSYAKLVGANKRAVKVLRQVRSQIKIYFL